MSPLRNHNVIRHEQLQYEAQQAMQQPDMMEGPSNINAT